MQKHYVVHVEGNLLGQVVVLANNPEEARARFWRLVNECDSSMLSLESSGYQIVDIFEISEEAAEASGSCVMD